MGINNNVRTRINLKFSSMTKGQRKLAGYILDNLDKAAFCTAERLGHLVGISEPSVVRFALMLGYKGYPQLAMAMQECLTEELNNLKTNQRIGARFSEDGVLASVLTSDMDKIESTLKTIDEACFIQALEAIKKAKHIYIVGMRSCVGLANYLGFYLAMMRPDVVTLTANSSSELFEQLMYISDEDVLIGISFPRYSMRTLKAMEFASNRRAFVVSLTDNPHSPMNMYSSCNLVAHSSMVSVVESLTAAMSVINALICGLYNEDKEKIASNLKMLDEIWEDYSDLSKDEIDYVDDDINTDYPSEVPHV